MNEKAKKIIDKYKLKLINDVDGVYAISYSKNTGKSAYGKDLLNYTITVVIDTRIKDGFVYWYVFDFIQNSWITKEYLIDSFDLKDMDKIQKIFAELDSIGVEVVYDN